MEPIQDPRLIKSPEEKRAFWQRHVELHQASGLSKKAYTDENQLNYDLFHYWSNRFKKIATSNPSLVPVTVKPVTSKDLSGSLCTLELRNGQRLYIHNLQALSLILSTTG